MSSLSLSREQLLFLVLELLADEKFAESVHSLEKESGFFFNMKYFEDKVKAGEWEEVDKYLTGFTKVDDNLYSTKIFFEIRKQKYFEALDRQDKAKALDILVTDLKVFSRFNEESFKGLTLLLTLSNFRENEDMLQYGDTKTARNRLWIELKKIIEANPFFRDKLLINESLNWQYQLWKDPRLKPDIKTLFADHTCSLSNNPVAPTPFIPQILKPPYCTPLGARGPVPPTAATAASANAWAGWMANASAASSVSAIPGPLNQSPSVVDYQNLDHGQLKKRLRPSQSVEEVTSPIVIQATQNGADAIGKGIEKPRIVEEAVDKSKPWKLVEITDTAHCRLATMPDSTDSSSKVVRLLYTNSGAGILALFSTGVQKLWKWSRNQQNLSGKATAGVVPQHWKPSSGLLMSNDVSGVNLEEAFPCIALSKNDSYVISACGGKGSLFNLKTFKVMKNFMPPPPASTFLAFHPLDNNIIAIGMEDSAILIYNVRIDEFKAKLKGHQKRITCLAFSTNISILVSSGADAQVCVWSIDHWERRKSVLIQNPAGKAATGDIWLQFHTDELHLLMVHETQLAIYDASKMERIKQWVPQGGLPAPISSAAYSCNSLSVYASFFDGNIGVFDADSLRPRFRIAPSMYVRHTVLKRSQPVYPLVITTHPLEPSQLAVGLSDGSVKVIEPMESDGQGSSSPPTTTSNHAPEPMPR